jgi:arylsulfatase A-like enzyme
VLRKVLDSPWTYAVPALLLAVAAVVAVLDLRLPSRPRGGLEELRALGQRDDVNVVFLVIDTLRADRLGCYGHDRPTSPMLDAIAADGIRFAQVQAASSWTKSSMASLWTGLDPVRTGLTRFSQALPEQAVLPAEILRDAGFSTVGIFRNSWVAPNFGFGQGFDAYLKPGMTRVPSRFERRPGSQLIGTDEDVTRSALAFIDSSGHERFFLYLHYMDVHQYAYDGTAAALGFGSTYRDNYDAAIHWVDRNVGLLLDALEQRDIFRRTIVVVSSDHGEGFAEHDIEGHARTLYTEVTHVPLLMAMPFRFAESVVVEPMVRNIDVWPTLLDLLGLPPLPDADGRSLVPEIAAALGSGEPSEPPPALSYLDQKWGKPEEPADPLVGIRLGGRSLILEPEAEEDVIVGAFEIDSDPFELENLAGEDGELPAWASELEARVRESAGKLPPWGETPEVELDELQREQLRALGYVLGN